ncbi:hypothetical protein Baya_5456 [Bagarius yarrelli]|uniref:Uncharacterized protein n=1 Tax=Bagarius yarrelli TaxID=175774 RepID=A0A556TUU9_BAGYA|nr:hypothetical protein Baya_5456 [Bagarius yarrelli]
MSENAIDDKLRKLQSLEIRDRIGAAKHDRYAKDVELGYAKGSNVAIQLPNKVIDSNLQASGASHALQKPNNGS